ncbi:hypothetical protein DFH28DRAFT_1129242 [Melampsora americana]|nr:hypothetical protein DFH28DRAFT_1129242 [Melampsora americana]
MNLVVLSNSSLDSDLHSQQISLESTRLSDERRRKLKRRIAGDILSPAPLFIPHAFLLLGLPIGLPILFLSAFLAWFSHVVLVVCGRYVGGRTYAQIASAVFPDRCKGFNLWFGESTVELSCLFISGGCGMVNMMMVSNLFAQLAQQYTPKAAILYSQVFIIPIAIGLIGFRLRQLDRELGRKLPPSGEGDVYSDIMGGTVWGGFSTF